MPREMSIQKASRFPTLKAYPLSHFMDDLSYGLVRKKNKYISPQAGAFIKYLLENPLPEEKN